MKDEELEGIMEAHVSKYHAFTADQLVPMVEEHNELTLDVPEIKRVVERIICVLEGEPIVDLHGNEISREGGMRGRQEMIERDLAGIKYDANGGRGFSIRNKDKLIIGTIAAIPAVVSLLIAYLALANAPTP